MSGPEMERRIGRVLGVAVFAGVAVLGVGIAGMALSGTDALARPFPEFDPWRLPSDLMALRPEGFLWLGLVAAILTPSVRVAASLVGFAAGGERRMAAVALAVLGVIGLSAMLGGGG